jgi:hypothetical protein
MGKRLESVVVKRVENRRKAHCITKVHTKALHLVPQSLSFPSHPRFSRDAILFVRACAALVLLLRAVLSGL